VDPTRPCRLEGSIQHYPWGSKTAIPELLGWTSPSERPCAELWIGAHPKAPAQVRLDGDRVPLDAWIAADPVAVLGERVAARFERELPFLFKVLSVASPLSIQAHPSSEQARAGFERENRAGIAVDDPRRNYRDPHPKPELVCALTRFEALNRFREPEAIRLGLAALGARDLAPLLADWARAPEGAGLPGFFEALMALDPTARERVAERASDWARGAVSELPSARWVARIAQDHPGDIGVLAPLLLNVVELEPGEAMFLPAGELHCYLSGVAIEIMANSDNVLRGGLTPKHVDVPELLRTLAFRSGPIETLHREAIAPAGFRYPTPAEEFELAVLEPAAGAAYNAPERRGVELLLCTDGSGRLQTEQSHALQRGDCWLIPAAAPGYRIEGPVTVYRAASGIAAG